MLGRPPKNPAQKAAHDDLRVTGDTIGKTIKRMMRRAEIRDWKRKSAHSLRKFHRSALSLEGISKEVIDRLQGKADGPYQKQEDVDPDKMFQLYVEAYDSLRLQPSETKMIRDLRDEIREREEALIAALKAQATTIERLDEELQSFRDEKSIETLKLQLAREDLDPKLAEAYRKTISDLERRLEREG